MVAALASLTLGPAAEALAAPADPTPGPGDPGGSQDPKLAQTVTSDEKVDRSPAEVGRGHVDLGPKFVDGQFVLMGRDDTVTPKLWRPLDQLVLRVNDKALLEVPDDKNYAFMDIPAGKKVHVIPQTQLPEVLWLGWNTQDPQVTRTIGRGADLVFLRHQGPGSVHVFLGNGFDAPLPLWDTRKPAGQKIFMAVNTHVHANWVFTEPGVHLVEVEVQATDQGTKEPLRARAVLHFAVGDAVSADQARAATMPSSSPSAASSPSTTPSSSSSAGPVGAGASEPPQDDSATMAVVGGGGVAALLAGAGAVALRQRRLRRQAWEDSDE